MATQQKNMNTTTQSEVFDVNALREISKKNMEVQQNNNEDRYARALEEAFQTVIDGAHEKLSTAAGKGFRRTYLYFFHYVDLKEHPEDKDMFRFQGCRMMDIIMKGKLLDKLNEYFNKDGGTGFVVGMRVFKNRDPRSYGIYVDWRDESDRKQLSNSDNEETQTQTKSAKAPTPAQSAAAAVVAETQKKQRASKKTEAAKK